MVYLNSLVWQLLSPCYLACKVVIGNILNDTRSHMIQQLIEYSANPILRFNLQHECNSSSRIFVIRYFSMIYIRQSYHAVFNCLLTFPVVWFRNIPSWILGVTCAWSNIKMFLWPHMLVFQFEMLKFLWKISSVLLYP